MIKMQTETELTANTLVQFSDIRCYSVYVFALNSFILQVCFRFVLLMETTRDMKQNTLFQSFPAAATIKNDNNSK